MKLTRYKCSNEIKITEFRVYTWSKDKCVELLNKDFQYDYICGSLYRLSRKF